MQRMDIFNNNNYLPIKQTTISPTAEKQPAGGSRSESATNTRADGQGGIPNQIFELPGTQHFSFATYPSALYFTGQKQKCLESRYGSRYQDLEWS